MKLSQLILLTLLLIGLGAGLVINKNQAVQVETRDLFIPLKLKIDTDAIHQIVIDRHKDSVELTRGEKGWVISSLWNAPVEMDKIKAFLKLLTYIEGEQRSKDASLLDDYGLSSEDAYHMKLIDDKKQNLAHLLIGTFQPDEYSVFVRKRDDNAVYLTQMPLLKAIDVYENAANAELNQQYWASLSLIDSSFDPQSIEKIQVVSIDGNQVNKDLSLKRNQENVWEMDYPEIPFEAHQARVEDMIRAATEGQALQVVDPNQDYGFRYKYWRVTIQGNEKLVYDISADGEKYYLRRRGKNLIYEISPHQAKRLTHGPVHFIADNPFAVQTDEIKELLMRYEQSEMFITSTNDSSNTLSSIVALFKDIELQLKEVTEPEAVKKFAENVPYEIVLRHADGKNGKAIGFGPLDTAMNRYPLQVKGSSKVYAVTPELFEKIFLPFNLKDNKAQSEQTPADTAKDRETAYETIS